MERVEPHLSGVPAWNATARDRWSVASGIAIGTAALATGGLFLPTVTEQLGVFPTLFLATVITSSIAVQLSELVMARRT